MAEEILASVQVRRDSKANWVSANPILLDGEAAYEKDTDMFKIGDGINRYTNLPYHNKVGPQGETGATPQISMNVSTGNPGSSAEVSVSGTAENPVINLTIPRGDMGPTGKTGSTGPKGETGNSGVYIGTTEPTDSNVNVWIDSDGEPTEVIDDWARDEISSLKDDISIVKRNVWNAIENGCDNTGATDITTIVNTAIANADDGTVFYFPKGKYRIEATSLVISHKNNITIIGDGSGWYGGTVFVGRYKYANVIIYGGDRVVIKDCSFYAYDDISPSLAIIYGDNTPTTMDCRVFNTVVENVKIQGYKSAIRVSAPSGYNYFRNVQVTRLAGFAGISIGTGFENTATNDYGDEIVPNYIYIDDCKIDNTNGSGLYGVSITTGQMIYIKNCDICNFTSGEGIRVSNDNDVNPKAENIYIWNNSIYKNKYGVRLYFPNNFAVHDIDISNNMFVSTEGSEGHVVMSAAYKPVKNVSISNNHFSHIGDGDDAGILINFTDTTIDFDSFYKAGIGM